MYSGVFLAVCGVLVRRIGGSLEVELLTSFLNTIIF